MQRPTIHRGRPWTTSVYAMPTRTAVNSMIGGDGIENPLHGATIVTP